MTSWRPRKQGFFYLIRLIPDALPNRIKLGWAVNPADRLRTHRCAAPTAILLCTWPCSGVGLEKWAISEVTKVGCHAVSGEVFDVDDVDRLIDRITQFFSEPHDPTRRRGVPQQPRPGLLLRPHYVACTLGIRPGDLNKLIRAGTISYLSTPTGQHRFTNEQLDEMRESVVIKELQQLRPWGSAGWVAKQRGYIIDCPVA